MFVMVMCVGDGREMTAATAAKAAAGSGLSAVGCSRSAVAMMMLTNGGVQYGFPPVYWEEPSCGQCVRRRGERRRGEERGGEEEERRGEERGGEEERQRWRRGERGGGREERRRVEGRRRGEGGRGGVCEGRGEEERREERRRRGRGGGL